MKRILSLIVFCIVCLYAAEVFAVAGSCVQTLSKFTTANPNLRILTFTCTGASDDGDFPSIDTTAAITSEIVGWYITEVRTYPGSKAPQDQWDVVINDSDGFDLMGGTLLNRAQTAQRALPLWTTGQYADIPIYGTLSIVITGNNVTSATPIIKIFLRKK